MSRRHGGLGLGLAIVKHLVELHGGTVRAKSGGPDQGATFVVALAADGRAFRSSDAGQRSWSAVIRAADPEPSAPSDAGLNLSGVKVLVVDDEEDARVLVQRVLEGCGARGADGRIGGGGVGGARRTEKPDVLVSDIGMPGRKRLRTDAPGAQPRTGRSGGSIPALALTAYARSEDRMKAVRAGFQMHVAKPVEAAELLTMVASLAGRSSG